LSNQDYEQLLDFRRSVSEPYVRARDTDTDALTRYERFREPSCTHNSSWDCPLAHLENRLPVKIQASEKAYLG